MIHSGHPRESVSPEEEKYTARPEFAKQFLAGRQRPSAGPAPRLLGAAGVLVYGWSLPLGSLALAGSDVFPSADVGHVSTYSNASMLSDASHGWVDF
jgi:hypothetical protein